MSIISPGTLTAGSSGRALDRVQHDMSDARGTMLSLDYSVPLVGHARSERINQMMNSHPAFEKSRVTQALLVRIQTSLRRMPGIAAVESGEIIKQLQEVGQVISQETSQLVDALANLTLDQQEADKSITRTSLEAKLARARVDDHVQTIGNLKDELASANNKREQAEAEVQKMMEDLRELSGDFKTMKDKVDASNKSSPGSDSIIKTLESTIQHLEEQVTNRRSLWIMKHGDAQSVARAIETLADSCPENEPIRKTLQSLRSAEHNNLNDDEHDYAEHQPSFHTVSQRAPSAFHPMNRPPTAGPPPKFGPLQAGPPRAPSLGNQRAPSVGPQRAPSTMTVDRRYQSAWGPPPATARSSSGNNALMQTPPFSRGPRKGYTTNRYRPNAPEFQPAGYGPPESGPSRPASTFGNRRDFVPNTPTTGPRGQYGRFPEYTSSAYGFGGPSPAPSNALVGRSPSVGPLIHMSERTLTAWQDRMHNFYDLVRFFIGRYAGKPQPGIAHQLQNSKLWPNVIKSYRPLSNNETGSYLEYHLKGELSKSCLVMRIIIDYIVGEIWAPTAWCGVDSESSLALGDLQKEFERTKGLSSDVRQPLLDRQATILDSLMKRDNIGSYYKTRVEQITGTLMSMLQPLLNKHTTAAEAYSGLEAVAESAWELSSSILTSRLTFDYRFPEIGSRFSAQSMTSVWPLAEPMELQSKHFRVALVTTPVVTCRNDTGTNISAHSVTLADVFCMQ